MSLKASWSKNHRDPTLNDRFWPVLGNPNLASESGYSSDLALQVEDKKVNWSLGGFYNQFEDLISWLPASDGQFRPINVSKSSSIGIESHIRIDIRNWLEARSSYTYTQSLIRRLEGGQNQANIYQPEHRFSFGFTVKTGQHAIGSTYDYSSTVRTDFLVNAHRLASIHLWDISYRWTPNKARAVSVGVDFNNLLNRNYQYVAQRPTAGRFLQFHLSIKINEKP
jgi:iron complex outermembrane receptor protein